MVKKHHLIYVPGIGDYRAYGQDRAIRFWRVFGIEGHYHPVMWLGQEPFEPKLNRLLAEVDSYLAAGDSVSLMGFSAGASAVLNAFARRRRQLTAVVCVSGKINRPHATAAHYFRRNPSFRDSLLLLQDTLGTFTEEDRAKFLTLNPMIDPVVPYKDAVIPGVKRWRTLAFSHTMSIFVALTLYAPFIAFHLKYTARQNKRSQK